MKNKTNFSSLPSEIYQLILSFAIDPKLLQSKPQVSSDIVFLFNFQSIANKISQLDEMQDYFNDFWWRVFQYFGSISRNAIDDFTDLKTSSNLKRKVLLMRFIKSKIVRGDFVDRKKKNMIEEYRTVVIGEEGVGKSALTIYYVVNMFVDMYDPTIEDWYRKQSEVDNRVVILEILDTVGNPDFDTFKNYINFGKCFIAVCSVDNLETVKVLRHQIETITKIMDRVVNDSPIVFAISKVDLLENNTRKEILQEFEKEINLIIKEFSLLNTSIVHCSAKKGECVDLVFKEAVRLERFYRVDGLEIMKKVIAKDSDVILEFKPLKKCSLM